MSNFWTSLPGLSGKYKAEIFSARRLMMAACVLLLSACGQNPAFNSRPDQTPTTTADGQTSIALPPEMSRPLLPGQSGTSYMPDGLPALQPARGMNIENLFAENIKDPVERVKRVENAVIELRRDLNAVMPAIIRLSAVEADMQELLRQLEALLRSEPPAASPVNYTSEGAPQTLSISPAPPSPPITAKQAVASSESTLPQSPPPQSLAPPANVAPMKAAGMTEVTNLRLGEHPGKTRLVMDINGPATYRYDLDNAENLLVIELPAVDWAASRAPVPPSPMVQSYSVQPMDGGGSRIIIQLKRSARISYEAMLPPESGNAHRLVLDLQGL